MLKKDQCWRCDTICLPPFSKISCSGCGIAIYCNEVCKQDDVFGHQVECQTAALKRKCAGCGKEKLGLKPCGSCRKQWYCDRKCQRNSWPTHKANCHAVSAKTEEMSRQLEAFYDSVNWSLIEIVRRSRFGNRLLLGKHTSRGSDQLAVERRCPVQQAFIDSRLRRWWPKKCCTFLVSASRQL